jgi:hypothetical protein
MVSGANQLRRCLTLLLAGAAMAMLVGCGSDSETAAAERPLNKAEFIRKAESICGEGVAEKEKVFNAGLPSGKSVKQASQAEIKQFVEMVAVEPYSKVVARLAQLRLPAGDKSAIGVVRGYEKALKETEADPLGAMELNPFLKPNEAAAAYGIKSCIL